ncbi:MAG: hypothetical protein IJD01_06980 [Clostridia bacterium]|nr:hypothetical protein [Clostridia bacterium]
MTTAVSGNKKTGGAMGAHLKKFNVFAWLSFACSIAMIVLLFLPWLAIPTKVEGQADMVSLIPGLITANTKNIDVLIFLIPLALGVIIVHGMYIASFFRPDHTPYFAGTPAMLIVGVTLFVFILAGDAAFSLVVKAPDPSSFLSFLGIDRWTWVPLTWFLIAIVQKMILVRFAHKKAPGVQ